jgi:hypothetical protein
VVIYERRSTSNLERILGKKDVEEAMKWSFPHFMYKGMLCSMAAFKPHAAVGFWKDSALKKNARRAKTPTCGV